MLFNGSLHAFKIFKCLLSVLQVQRSAVVPVGIDYRRVVQRSRANLACYFLPFNDYLFSFEITPLWFVSLIRLRGKRASLCAYQRSLFGEGRVQPKKNLHSFDEDILYGLFNCVYLCVPRIMFD